VTIVAIGATLFILGLYPNLDSAATFNLGNKHIDVTPQGGLAVSSNGGKATAQDNSVAYAKGQGAQSDASGHCAEQCQRLRVIVTARQ